MKTETENSQNENINIEEPAVEEKTAKRPGRPRRKTTDKPATVRKTAARSTKKKNLCTVPAADLTDSQYFIAEDGGELKRIPKAQVVLKKLENMLATDTENLAGGGEVTAQELLDALAEQVANKLLAKSQVVNNLLATVEGNPLDATQGKALKELIDTTNNNLSKLNGKMLGSNYVMNYSDFSDLSVNVYSVETFATTPSGNAPENNVGDFRITRLGMNNSKYNTLILTSPRYKTSVSMSQEFYVGNFWDGIWMGWERLANKSALDNLTSLYNTTKANYEKGSTFLDDIGPLSFPSQLKHAGFYKLPTMTADVNADAGSETMTEYTTGDFYGLLLGEDINTTDGCVYGTLIVSSPRIKSAIWVGNIWQKKFISWYKIGKS